MRARCYACRAILDLAASTRDETPAPGSIVVCYWCANVGILGARPDGQLVVGDPGQFREALEADQEISATRASILLQQRPPHGQNLQRFSADMTPAPPFYMPRLVFDRHELVDAFCSCGCKHVNVNREGLGQYNPQLYWPACQCPPELAHQVSMVFKDRAGRVQNLGWRSLPMFRPRET